MPSANALKAGSCGAGDRGEEALEPSLGLDSVPGAVDGAETLLERPGLGQEGLVLEELAEAASLTL